MREKYAHSGAVPPLGGLLTIVAGLVAAVVLGFIYTYFIVYVPFIYLNFIGTLAFGGGIGFAVGWAAHKGHARSNAFVTGVAILCALAGIYVEWGATPMALIDSSIGLAGFHPLVVVATVQILYQEGSWGLFGEEPVRGIFLAVIWLIESGVILFAACIGARVLTSGQPYCEFCHRWTDTREGVNHLQVPSDPIVLAQIAEGNLDPLETLTRGIGLMGGHLRLDLSTCPDCDRSNYLTVQRVEIKSDNDGDSQSLTALIQNVSLQPDEVVRFSTCGKDLTPTSGGEPTPGDFDFLK